MKKLTPSSNNVHDLIERYRESLIQESVPARNGHESKPDVPLFFQNRIAISVAETALLLGLSARSVERMIKRGEIEAKKTGRRKLILTSSLKAWLNRKD